MIYSYENFLRRQSVVLSANGSGINDVFLPIAESIKLPTPFEGKKILFNAVLQAVRLVSRKLKYEAR